MASNSRSFKSFVRWGDDPPSNMVIDTIT